MYRRSYLILLCVGAVAAQLSAHVDLDYPSGGEVFSAGGTVIIQWTEAVPHDTENWDLFYSSDGGTTWDTVMIDVPYAFLNHNWSVPSKSTNQGMIRVRQDNPGRDYESTSGAFSIQTLLPVEMTGFRLTLHIPDQVGIAWSTHSEVNNERFDIEKSYDRENFMLVKTLPGAGFSSELLHYQYVDEVQLPGQYYYRIKAVSQAGEIE